MNERERQKLADAVQTVRRAMTRDFLVQALASLGESDLTLLQLGVLMLLEDGQARAVKEVAETIGRSVSATSRLLDQLAVRKLVKRSESPDDRRVRLIALADAGKRVVAHLLDRRAEAQLSLMQELTAEEQAAVLAGIVLLAEAAKRKGKRGRERMPI